MHRIVLALLAAGTVSVAASGSAKASSPIYPYCIQSTIDGTDCSYPSYGACMAAASGRGVECIVNPIVAFSQRGYPDYDTPPPRRARRNPNY
jgi:hypothetical protein